MNPVIAHPTRGTRLLFVLATLALLGGCGAMVAQNPSGSYTPVNAVAVGDAPRVLLGGADVVAYFAEGQYRQGRPEFASRYEEITFHFASAEHKALFDQEPARYLPQFGGYCTNGVTYGIPWGGNADVWRMIAGRLYVFGGAGSRDAFELDTAGNLARANRYWEDEIKGNNSWWQRAKRLVFRVPHYQSDAELAQAVAAKRAVRGGQQ
jgi:YHS domain-containing protein